MTEITFQISDDWGGYGTGYAPKSQRFTAALGSFDLDCPIGTGETPYEAILELLEQNIDQFIEADEMAEKRRKKEAAECYIEDHGLSARDASRIMARL